MTIHEEKSKNFGGLPLRKRGQSFVIIHLNPNQVLSLSNDKWHHA